MKRERGNIILTALFVSVFLFFLSIALIWTNRQDIALSLAMEHKMKAEAAARSGAMKVYAGLRNFDQPPAYMEATLSSGATWKAELVELPPEGYRGALVLLRCRGTSGPLSSYYTLHLLKTELGSSLTAKNGRMLGFLSAGAPPGPEEGAASAGDEPTPAVESAGAQGTFSSTAKVLYGDFELKDIDLAMDPTNETFAAYQGPLFVSGKLPQAASPFQVVAYLPVFSPLGGAGKAYGPVILFAPTPPTENGLSVMTYQSEEFKWENIPLPIPELDIPSTPPISSLNLEAPKNAAWNTLATRTISNEGRTFAWRDTQPATSREEEALDLVSSGEFEIDANRTIDWGSATGTPNKRGYVLNGAIAAHGKTVYSYAWEYMYKHFNGQFVAAPVPLILGSTITRWPCVRKYNLAEKEWSTAWSGLKDNGDVSSAVLPDLNLLLVNSEGTMFSRTNELPRRLVRLDSGGNLSVGDEIPGEKMFMYQNEPHAISQDPEKPGIKNLVSRKLIGFETLPSRIPEIAGPVVVEIDNETMDNGLSEIEVSPLGTDMKGLPEMRTVRQEHNFTYQLDPAGSVATDGDDLYAQLTISMTKEQPTHELFGNFEIEGPAASVMARYDGTRWHILPHGLLAALTNPLPAPGGEMFCAYYEGLPDAKSRYTVVSIDVDPFELSR
jgi:hypothetical protein